MWKYITGAVVIGGVTYGLMKYFAGGVCRCTTRLDGLTIIVTGANSGLGRTLSFELAERGANLILACRNLEQGYEVKTAIQLAKRDSNVNICVAYLDLTSFDSVRKFAEFVDSEFEEIYGLVNNAGVFYHPQGLTDDGFDVTFQTNYLAPFLLTHLLVKVLKRSDHARVVNVVSEAHRLVNGYDLTCLTINQNEFRTHFIAYGVSKLALLLFTREFAKKLSNTNIIINGVDPGNVETSIYRYFPQLSNPWLYALQWPIRRLVVKRPIQGVQSILHELLTSNRSTGQYIRDCKPFLPSPVAGNDRLAAGYYSTSLNLLDGFLNESIC